jgi:hypothetical protein
LRTVGLGWTWNSRLGYRDGMKHFKFTLRDLFWLMLVGMSSLSATADDAAFARFKEKTLLQVGKSTSFRGTLKTGKLAEYVATDDGGAVYLMVTRPQDAGALDELLTKLDGKRVMVSGRLQYRKRVPPPEPGISAIPEHFFIDVSTLKVEAIGNK